MNILVIIPSVVDACSYYRGLGPLGHLEKNVPNTTLTITGTVTWYDILKCDLVYVTRPMDKSRIATINLARMAGKPVIVEWDDDPLSVPPHNPAWIGHQEHRGEIVRSILTANLVIVSTDAIKKSFMDKLGMDGQNIRVIPNAVDGSFLNPPFLRPKTSGVIWRGSSTHMMDLESVREGFLKSIKDAVDTKFSFLGSYPSWAVQEKNVQVLKGTDLVEYWQLMQEMNPAILTVPLENTEFNQCKSNCSWLEGTCFGAVTLAPKGLTEFEKPGVVMYEGSADFGFKLNDMINGTIDLDVKWNESANYIRQNLTLDQTNKQRIKLIQELI